MAVRGTRDGYVDPTFDSVMKRFYDGTIGRLFPTWHPALEWIQRKGKKIKPQGEKLYFAVETALGSSVGPRGEHDDLPTADTTTSVQGSVDYNKGFKGRIALSAEAMKFMKSGKGAFSDALKQESRGLVDAMKMEAQPAIWGSGNGILGKTSTTVASGAVVAVSSELSTECFPGTRWLREGQRIDLVDSTADYVRDTTFTTTITTNKISSIASDTSFQLNGASNASTGSDPDRFFAAMGSTTTDEEDSYRGPVGLLAMCDDDTLYDATNLGGYCGISSTTYPSWKGVVSDNAGTAIPLTLRRIYRLYNKLARRAGSLNLDLACWTNPDLFEEVVELLEHHVEFKPQSLKGGFKEVEIAIHEGAPIKFKLDFAAPGYIMMFDPSKMVMAEGMPLELASEDGSKFHRMADKDQYELRWRWGFNLYTTKRNAHGMLADISYTVSSV